VRDLVDGRRAHVCGLSAGAVVGVRVAARHPELAESLLLAAVQVRPPRALVAAQATVMRLIPGRSYWSEEDPEVTKAAVLGALRALSRVDLRADLGRVRARTQAACGSKDRADLAAARQAVAGIAGAELRLIPGAGHAWNESYPAEFH
jgi:3-oxoadipate enol-lactonase